ncbi:MAG: OmpA family protein [Gammaproteobacteria bacterium]|nr:MAG: OmpA family protein [Gammaproteobacteria bacterium]
MLTKLITITILSLTSIAQAEQFQAPITHTHWQVVESPLECTLSQLIPGFGEAKFSQLSGKGDFTLVFITNTHLSTQNNVSFEVSEARWQNIEQRLHLISVPTLNNQMQFTLSGELAKHALTHLEEGRAPAIRYYSKHMNEEISVLISTVHATDSIPAFRQCLANLSPYTFDDNNMLTIHFELEKSNLSNDAQEALTTLANYIKIDDSIKRVAISGHTDNHGRRSLNGPLAESRAIVIKNFLVEQGEIPEKLITTSYYLERKPIATNKSLKGRALNRRSEIELIR